GAVESSSIPSTDAHAAGAAMTSAAAAMRFTRSLYAQRPLVTTCAKNARDRSDHGKTPVPLRVQMDRTRTGHSSLQLDVPGDFPASARRRGALGAVAWFGTLPAPPVAMGQDEAAVRARKRLLKGLATTHGAAWRRVGVASPELVGT